MNRRSCQLQALVLTACVYAASALSVAAAQSAGDAAKVPVHLLELEASAKRAQPWQRTRDARLQSARARIDAARAAYSPTLNLLTDISMAPGARIVNIQGYKVSAAFPLDTGANAFLPAARFGVMLDAHSNVYDFGRTSAAVDAAEAEARADQADLHNGELQTVHDVRAGYLRWATAYALWAISQRGEQAARETLARTQAAIEEGARRSADSTAAESGAGFAQLELERALSELESARDDLGYVAMTDFAETAYPADDVLNVQEAVATLGESQQARLQVLREQRTAAQASARAHDHAFTPVISANAQAGLQGLNDSFFPVYRIGVSLVVPLWDGGTESASRAQALARGAQLGAQAAELERAEVRTSKHSQTLQRQAQRRIGVADKLVATCNKRVAQLEAATPLSAASYVELSDARNALSRAETELVLARALRAQVMLGVE